MRLLRLVLVGLGIGVLLNLLGWLGNGLILREWWADAIPENPRFYLSGWSRVGIEAVSTVSDFVFAMALVWLYLSVQPRFGPGFWTACRVAAILWLVGVAVPYIGLVKLGFLPASLAVATSAIAAVSFAPAAWLVARLCRVTPAISDSSGSIPSN